MKTKKQIFPIVIGVLVLLSMVYNLSITDFDYLPTSYAFLILLSELLNIPLALALFMNKRKLALIPYAGYVLITLLYVINYVSLHNILSLLANIAMLSLILSIAFPVDKIGPKIRKCLWFIPGAMFLLAKIINIIQFFDSYMFYPTSWYFTSLILPLLIYLAVGYWAIMLCEPQGNTYATENGYADGATFTSASTGPYSMDGYRDLLTHILLLLFTCGIWQLIWIYKTTAYLNKVSANEQQDATVQLLLCMFVPFYSIYWTYKNAQRIDSYARSVGQQSDISMLCLILSIFVGIIPPILMQDKINSIVQPKGRNYSTPNYSAPNHSAPNYSAPNYSTPDTSAQNMHSQNTSSMHAADEIMKYKMLLDAGAITQEEFDAKKKQLLGL